MSAFEYWKALPTLKNEKRTLIDGVEWEFFVKEKVYWNLVFDGCNMNTKNTNHLIRLENEIERTKWTDFLNGWL